MLKILLLSNYEKDRQESMLRFANVLQANLPHHDISSELIRPQETVGRLVKSNNGLGKWLGYCDKYLFFPRDLRKKCSVLHGSGRFVVHICDHSNAIYTRYLKRTPHLVTCNDLLAIRSARGEIPANRTRWSGRQLQRLILTGLNGAQRVTCISEATRLDLSRLSNLSPSQIDLTYMGLNFDYRPVSRNEAQIALHNVSEIIPNQPFLLHVGGNQWYKNRLGVLQIYNGLLKVFPTAPRLVMAGKAFTPEMIRFVDEKQLSGRVCSLTQCSNEQLRALYALAELLLFPSLEEGFGWPIIEAQACGCRVLTTNKAPMTEAGGKAAFYFNPADFETASAVIRRILDQTPEEKAVSIQLGMRNAAQFSTDRMLENYICLYDSLNRTSTGT
jgi:glycosyltransferase involved in cell wall biosynthesis